MEGSARSTGIRLRVFLEETGTRHGWLAAQLGISKTTLSSWLSGDRHVCTARRHEILRVLRQRQLLQVPTDLFEEE